MSALDDLVAKVAAHQSMVDACDHDFSVTPRLDFDLGKQCSRCGTHELPWLRRRLGQLEAAIAAAVLAEREACLDEVVAELLAAYRARGHTAGWYGAIAGAIAVAVVHVRANRARGNR
jgi:hypothetical protein